MQKIFDYFVRNNLTPLYPEDRSVGRDKGINLSVFAEKLNLDYTENKDEIVQMVLSEGNIQHFVNVISLSKDEYMNEVSIRMPS